jgi:hypothetical protein
VSLPILKGTTDIYSYDQAYLFASDNKWMPRPVFQSYSAYTPKLIEANLRHLMADSAPDNIFFSTSEIDDRLPSLEDGASWPALLTRYEPMGLASGFFMLHKKENIVTTDTVFLRVETHQLNERVEVAPNGGLIFIEIDINPTFFGRVKSILYKPDQLFMTIESADGVIKKYRMIAGMAKSGFMVSPLIENTNDFSRLYEGPSIASEKAIKSFTITSERSLGGSWQSKYIVTFKQLNLPR